MATPARWREVGELPVIMEEVSETSDWSSASRSASWVAQKEGMSTGLGAMMDV